MDKEVREHGRDRREEEEKLNEKRRGSEECDSQQIHCLLSTCGGKGMKTCNKKVPNRFESMVTEKRTTRD